MVKLFSCKAHDGDYFWLRYKHDEEKLYHNLVIDGGRKSNASDFYEMLKHICKNGEQIDAMVLTHFDQDHIMGMFAGLQKAQKKNYIPKIAALYLNTGKGYWKHHQSLEGSEPLPEETVKIPMTDAPGYSANDLKKLTDFLQEYGLEEHICSYIVQSCEEIHIGNAKCYIISPSDASLKDLIQNFSDFMQVSPVTPYGGADPEWSKPLDELSGYDTPEDTSLSIVTFITTPPPLTAPGNSEIFGAPASPFGGSLTGCALKTGCPSWRTRSPGARASIGTMGSGRKTGKGRFPIRTDCALPLIPHWRNAPLIWTNFSI